MTQDQPVIRIGELLVQSGVITTYDLSEAEKLSSHMKVQFGRLLIMAGCLTEEALECALEAQGLIKEGVLTAQIACEALAFAVQENIPLRQALEALDCLPQFGTSTLRLAELIHDANIIDEERLHDAFDTSMETNRPLPEVLVEMECISPGLLSIMLRMQEQIRNETLDHEDSINELRGTFKIWKRADKAMANDPMSKSAIIGAPAPEKPSRFTSSFDTVNRLPAISEEMLATLNKESRLPNASSGGTQSALPGRHASTPRPPIAPAASAPAAGSPGTQSVQNAQSAYSSQNLPKPANPPGALNAPGAPRYPNTPPANFQAPPAQYPSQSPPAAHNAQPANTRPPSQNASARGGKDDLNVEWILNAPAGQPMPEEVILYSQGYFPPDPKKPESEEAFNDGFSDEDEQRINDLLDVFASDDPAADPNAVGADTGQLSYSASLAAAAADGWGVPDLAAAGANLSGAEMFARAQAELASGGWAYGQGSPSQTGQKFPAQAAPASSPSAYSGARTQPPVAPTAAPTAAPPPPPAPAVASGPLGQPTFVTPLSPTPPSAPAQFAPPQTPPPAPSRPEALAAAPEAPSSSLTSSTQSAPVVPAPMAAPAPEAKTPTAELSLSPPPSMPTATTPEIPALRVPGAEKSSQLLTPSIAITPAPATPATSATAAVPSIPAPSPWAAPPSLAPSDSSGTSATWAPPAPSTTSTPETPSATSSVTDTREDSLFSPTFKDSISDALQSNPFKIRKVGETDSSTNLAAVPTESKVIAPETESEPIEAKTIDDHKSKVVEEKTADKSDSEDEQDRDHDHDARSKSEQESKPESDQQSASTVPTGPRGKFGTKTGLAAKRKASEGSEDNAERNDVVFLLKSADFFSADELEDAIVNSLRDQNKAIEILGILGIIDKSNLDAAVRLQKLVKSGSVDVAKAIESLTDLKSGKMRASELTEQLGIKKSKRRK
jgi:hypothetical protein